MNNDYSLIHLLKVLARWKKQILIATALVALASVAGSLMMDTYYKSTAVLYPASPSLADPDPIGGLEKVSYIYGTPEDLDRLFSIANSGLIKNHVIDQFGLASHYDVDTTTAKGKAKLMAKFSKLFETKKTKFDALQISIEDTDPVKARDMVKAAREKITSVAQSIIKESQYMSIQSMEEGIKEQERGLKTSGDSLTVLKDKYEIYDSYAQAKAFAEITASSESALLGQQAKLKAMLKYGAKTDSINMARAMVAGLEQKMISVNGKIKNFNEGVLSVRLMEVAQNQGVQEIAIERERLKKLQSSYNKSFKALHIVEREQVPHEKSRPRRSIIVIGLTMLAFGLSCLAVLLIDSTKHINWREIYAGE